MHAILQACSTPHGALSAPFAFLCTIPGLSRAAATALAARTAADGERILVNAAKLGAIALLPDDALFPSSLREIPDAPTVLFAKGRLELFKGPAVAIVGSRDHTPYGAEVCRMIAREAAYAGITVISGMARGLDAIAHEAALDAGGTTIGVLGNGLGVIYPAANRALYERVGKEGLLLSEFPPGERPQAWNFPRRNRLISGLARVTVVVEAAHGSGALITANTGLDQGRDIMAVPGPITSEMSVGTNTLIRDGAEPLLSAAGFLTHYPECMAPNPKTRPISPALKPVVKSAAIPIPPEFAPIANCLGVEPVHIDAISLVSGIPPGDCLAALVRLELLGAVEQRPGSMFRLVLAP